MQLEWQKIAPVIISILLIVCIAIARTYSKTFAAIISTMPINIALSLWIVASAEDGKQAPLTEFTAAMLRGIIPTVVFVFAAWLTVRAGWQLVPVLLASYIAWAASLGMIFLVVKQ
jgi:hypothetical protein